MHKGTDSRIQAQVRILLARRWVDLKTVTIGTTNGVVYIGGDLRKSGGTVAPSGDGDTDAHERWVQRIRREISEIQDVRDVVFQLSQSGGEPRRWQDRTV